MLCYLFIRSFIGGLSENAAISLNFMMVSELENSERKLR